MAPESGFSIIGDRRMGEDPHKSKKDQINLYQGLTRQMSSPSS